MARSKEKTAAAAAAAVAVPPPTKDITNKYQALCVSLDTLANAAQQASYAASQYMSAAFPGINLGEQNFFGAFSRPKSALGGPTTEEAEEEAAEDGQPAKRRKRTKNTTPKDPNAPKKPLTAYFAFAKVSRPEVVAELPGASNKEITEELAARWANMKDTGEQQPFRDQYAIEMKTYNKVLAVYKAKLSGLPVPEEVVEAEVEEEEEEEPAPPPKPIATPKSAKGKKEKSESSKKKSSKDKATPKEKSSRKRSTKEVTPPPSAGEEEQQPAPATKSPRKRKRKAAD
ncbi:hypothetical protein H072_3464 [Dactylellina haptotyla CBS 200.50]|uniref:HMG box domain-containing protein n=1 Tax=Dactylellina haptotyla (strain CBS 200.50) TaxID=1284197 RepID=S8C4E6_DACHA|nr:hypothetical protein H072_3464 [Dactylellina haptotyla CBS 200.50]